ncbi:MAG: Uma2 family endonuclease [Verrucomicrobia bacterium]|nr:Uma2 family endonuclease [Verrucomicrobiota bacterium]
MTALRQASYLLSIEDYLAGEEQAESKHEYLGGVVHAMAGASNRHNTIASNFLVSLVTRLRGKPCQAFNSDTKVRITFPDHTRFYYPDAMVVCHLNPETDHFQDHPVLIIEVLSESTRRADLTEKRDAYLTLGTLKVLIFVEPDEARVILYRRSLPQGGFAVEEYAGRESVIPLPEIEAEIALGELYERVSLD